MYVLHPKPQKLQQRLLAPVDMLDAHHVAVDGKMASLELWAKTPSCFWVQRLLLRCWTG